MDLFSTIYVEWAKNWYLNSIVWLRTVHNIHNWLEHKCSMLPILELDFANTQLNRKLNVSWEKPYKYFDARKYMNKLSSSIFYFCEIVGSVFNYWTVCITLNCLLLINFLRPLIGLETVATTLLKFHFMLIKSLINCLTAFKMTSKHLI